MNRFVALFSDLDPESAGRALRDLRFSNADIAWITSVLARWRQIEKELREELLRPTFPPAATVRRWVGAAGRTRVRAVLRLAAARFAAERRSSGEAPSAPRMRILYREALRTAFRDPVEISDLAVDGDDLRATGIPPGPMLGRILTLLLTDVLEDPTRNTSEWLVPRARDLFSQLER